MSKELIWEPKTWQGLTDFDGFNIWTDGTHIYYSEDSDKQYVLNGDTWEPKTWYGLESLNGAAIWTDGTNIYCSESDSSYVDPDTSRTYVLNGDTWEPKTWQGFNAVFGLGIWTDGTHMYYSYGSDRQYVLNGDTWEPKTWQGFNNIYGSFLMYLWTDGTHIYYTDVDGYNPDVSEELKTYVLNGDTWTEKTFYSEISDPFPISIGAWNYKGHTYFSYGETHLELDGDTWKHTSTVKGGGIIGAYIWTDGTHTYSSYADTHYVLTEVNVVDKYVGNDAVGVLVSHIKTNANGIAGLGSSITNLESSVAGKVTGVDVTTIRQLTQSQYDALNPKDSSTLYVIVD